MIELITAALILAVSLIVLVIASHFTIKSVEDLIAFTGLSEASVGFAILAVMTSTPEITVALFSILQGTPGISAGDILGSNVFNIGVVIGILGMFGYLKTCCTDLLVELTDILFVTSMIPLLLVVFKVASRFVGVILLGIFVFNIYIMTRKRTPAIDRSALTKGKSRLRTIIMLVGGIAIVLFASRLVVSSAHDIAIILGASPILIGAKIIAIGTSLPELTLDLTAARKGRIHLALGDIIGSNLTNITLVLGLLLIASPFEVNITIFAEILPFILISTIIFWRYLTRGGVSQIGGIVLIMTYVLFEAILQ